MNCAEKLLEPTKLKAYLNLGTLSKEQLLNFPSKTQKLSDGHQTI